MRNREIERKFQVKKENVPDLSKMCYMDIVQGYIFNIESDLVFRLRQVLYKSWDGNLIGEDYFQTIKGKNPVMRIYYESRIWRNTFNDFWPLCETSSIHKYRYEIPNLEKKYKIYLDSYKNSLNGLYTAEVEFQNVEDCNNYTPEPWFGMEVTEDPRFSNTNLVLFELPDVEF